MKCDTDFNLMATAVTAGPGIVSNGVASGWSRPAERVTSVAGVSQALQPGAVLGGRYEILQLLGEGGMGAVYKARDRELDRFVALKIIRPELASQPEVLRRFKQELILARQVTHKNVIRIFDLGEADGIKFISMDFIEGRDLRSLLREKGKLGPEEATAVMLQVCQALEAAHAEGVVHRDLKPQNIMIDSQGRAIVMDFGIARSMGLTGMTQTGALLGTPEYMSPEQAKGQEVDARSDLFTLGIIFYELLTGRMPYQADTLVATLLKRIQERARPPIELDSSIPQYLSDIVVRCLEINPATRYQNIGEMITDLETQQAPRAPTLRLRMPRLRMVEEYRARWIVAGLIAIPLIIAAVVFRAKIFAPPVKLPGPVTPAISLAILPFHNASGDPALDWLGPGLAEMLRTDIGQSAHLRTVSADNVDQILHDLRVTPGSTLDPDTLRRVADLTNAEKLVWGQFSRLGDHIRIDATLRDPAQQRSLPLQVEAASEKDLPSAIAQLAQSIQKSLSLSRDIIKELQSQALRPSTASLQALRDYNEGLEFARQGKNLEAQKKFQASTQDDAQFALAFSRLAQVDAKLGYDGDAEAASRQAVDLSDKLSTQERYLILAIQEQITKDYPKAIEAYENLARAAPGDASLQFSLGGLYEDTGALDKAREHYSSVMQAEPKNADALLAVGRVELKSGNLQGGIDYLSRALNLAIEFENQEERALILQALGVAYQLLHKPDDALGYYRQALEIRRTLKLQLGIADSLGGIAQVQVSKGQIALALKNYLESIQIRREIGDKKGLADDLVDLGDLYNNLGQYDAYLKAEKQALEVEHEVGDRTSEALVLNNIGVAYLSKGQYEDSRTYFEQALRIRQELKVPDDIAQTFHNLGETSLNMGEFDPALKNYMHALEFERKASDQKSEAITSDSLATLFSYQGQYGRALQTEEDALKSLGEAHETGEWLATITSDYGRALSEVGRFEEGQKTQEKALQLARQIQNQADIAKALNLQGDGFFYAGDLKSAGRAYEEGARTAAQTSDRRLILQSKLNRAKLEVRLGRASSVIDTLKSLAQDADIAGMKYLSVDASLYVADALIETHNYAQARVELERALVKSEKMNLRGLLARGHFLMATTLRLAGQTPQSERELDQARQTLSDIRKEAGESVMKRSDFAAIVKQPS